MGCNSGFKGLTMVTEFISAMEELQQRSFYYNLNQQMHTNVSDVQ